MTVLELQKSDVTLCDWNILQVTIQDKVTELFIGYSVDDQLGRLSTPIASFDEEAGIGATESGSTYTLIGEPGLPHEDAMYVLNRKLGKEAVERDLFSDDSTGRLSFRYPVC